jgi:hypothetical protein
MVAMQSVPGTGTGFGNNAYRRLLTQGTFYSSALQLSNVSAVLPLICAQLGSRSVAGLLFPIFNVGAIAAGAASPYILRRSRHLKHLVFAAAAVAMAVLTAGAAVSADRAWFINVVFLVTAAGVGLAKGVSDGAHAELIAANLPHRRRSQLVLGEGAGSAVIVVAATLLVLPDSTGGSANGHVMVLWMGAAGMIGAAIVAYVGGPVHHHAGVPIHGIGGMVRRGVRVVRSQRWFRTYVLTQVAFVPVGLSTMFYGLYATSRSGGGVNVLVFVGFSSIGVLLGVYLWRVVHRAWGIRGMLVASSLMAVATAILCIVAHVLGVWSQTWLCGLVFALAAAANKAVWASAIEWLASFAHEHDRALLMGFGLVAVGAVTSVLAVALGRISQHAGAVWPVVIVLGLSLVAVVAAARAPAA